MTLSEPTDDAIRIRGARMHNLQNIDVDLPRGKLIIVSGVSGSGKSSLVMETLLAEGRRRYLACLSSSAGGLLQELPPPDVDQVDGLPPVLGLGQHLGKAGRRSTAGTVLDVYDPLRILFARFGTLYCPTCQTPVTSQSQGAIVERLLQLPDRTKLLILAPIARKQRGSHLETLQRIAREGFVRARIDGELVDVSVPPVLDARQTHDIEIVVDRLMLKEGLRPRLEESLDVALQLGRQTCLVSVESADGWQDRLISSQLYCTTCEASYPPLESRLFSFRSAYGACPDCHGLGEQSSEDGQLPATCPTCRGGRLGVLGAAVRIGGRSLPELCLLPLAEAHELLSTWQASTGPDGTESPGWTTAAVQLLPEVTQRLGELIHLGLDYATLHRAADTLSRGELQRVRLAGCLATDLADVCYVLDEPTSGLHPLDLHRLSESLNRLREQGNTVVLVEHELSLMAAADHVIDLGPGAGREGGRVVASGPPAELSGNPASPTGLALTRRQSFQLTPSAKRPAAPTLELRNATRHNLQQVSVDLPLGELVCVTGPSGSGKTTLIQELLVPALQQKLGIGKTAAAPLCELAGWETLQRVICVDQSPLGRTSRSTPATAAGLWEPIRRLYSRTREARLRGFGPQRFSFLHPEGRCPECRGKGVVELDAALARDWSAPCPACRGRRFHPRTLSVLFKGKSVADVLEMTMLEAADFFASFDRLSRPLQMFCELGLGYLLLGQSAATLSGGEAQRVKLVAELATRASAATTMFVLDEPTAGLHALDVDRLVDVLDRLVQSGHSVVAIEHNLELIRRAQTVIDLGPGSGSRGGTIVAVGSPWDVAQQPDSPTGRALRNNSLRT